MRVRECSNCHVTLKHGESGHFVPPCLGDPGFFICDQLNQPRTTGPCTCQDEEYSGDCPTHGQDAPEGGNIPQPPTTGEPDKLRDQTSGRCPNCGGCGQVEIGDEGLDVQQCGRCKGSGRLMNGEPTTGEGKPDHTKLIQRIGEAINRISKMCSEGRPPKMSIPVRPEDDDIFISETLVLCRDVLRAAQPPGESVVVLNPKIRFGAPTIQGTRIATEDITSMLRGSSEEETAEAYNVSVEAVRAALRFEEVYTSPSVEVTEEMVEEMIKRVLRAVRERYNTLGETGPAFGLALEHGHNCYRYKNDSQFTWDSVRAAFGAVQPRQDDDG